MKKSVTFIVQTFLDYDRKDEFAKFTTPEWVEKRIEFFHEFTLKSLLSQSFQDFRIFVLCGERHRKVTENIQWHERVEVCYDNGQSKYAEIDTDYVSITRIDSDDLYHKDAMAEIKASLILTSKRECLIFRKCLVWHTINRYVGRHHRTSPPFYTHIFPRKIYKDWARFETEHFMVHGQAGGRLPKTKELSKHRACVIKHDDNFSLIRRTLTPHVMSEEERQILRVEEGGIVLNREEMVSILEDFSVDEKWIK